MNSGTSPGTSSRRRVSACISPSSTTSAIFCSIVAPIPGSSFACPSSASCDGRRRVTDARGGAAVGEHPEARLAEQLRQVGQQVELVGDLRVAGQRLATRRSYVRLCVIRHACDRLHPTYNERENLERMVVALGDVLDLERDRILVVDDNSPDGTGEIADRLSAELPWVDVSTESAKRASGGRTSTPFGTCSAATRSTCSRWTATSLRPAGPAAADCGLRGRRRPGARLALRLRRRHAQLGLVRRFISRGGSLYAQAFLGVGVRDLTGGFKCFSRNVLETIDLAAVTTNGYAFQIELTYRALRRGFRVKEVPITFVDREVGGSKMSRAIVAEAVWKVPALRLRALGGRL